MASNETKNPRRAQMRGPGGPGGAMTGEKAKDFKKTMKTYVGCLMAFFYFIFYKD